MVLFGLSFPSVLISSPPPDDSVSPAISLSDVPLLSQTSLVSVVAPGCILTSEDFELGASDEREHAELVPLGLCHLTQYNLS